MVSQFQLKYQLATFQSFQWQQCKMQSSTSSLSMQMMFLTSAILSNNEVYNQSSFTNFDSKASFAVQQRLNSLVLLALEQVQRSCKSDSQEILRFTYYFGRSSLLSSVYISPDRIYSSSILLIYLIIFQIHHQRLTITNPIPFRFNPIHYIYHPCYKSFTMIFEQSKTLCKKGGAHSGKEVIMICVNPECDTRRLCCLACIDEFHRKHELISLYKFNDMLKVLTEQSLPETRSAIIASVSDFQQRIISAIDIQANEFMSMVDKCKEQLLSIFNRIKESINLNFTQADIEDLFGDLNNNNVCEYLAFIKEAENQNFKNVENAEKTLKLAENNFIKQLQQSEKIYLKGVEEVNKGISRLKLLIQTSGPSKKRLFSKINIAAPLHLNETLDEVKRAQGSGGYPIVLVDDPITEINNSVTVMVKQQPGNKGVWMGVCVLDIVKNFNFSSCYGIGKGTWAIDQVGANHQSSYSWSHHDTNFNSQPKGWQFHTGDVVTIKVNLQSKLVIFSKPNHTFQAPIRTDLGDLYFFVGPTHINDMICLV